MARKDTAGFLTREQERELIRKAQAGDIAARNTLVERNLGLIWKRCIAFSQRNPQYTSEELVGTATLGYMHAITRFDLKQKVRLSTYTVRTMDRCLLRMHQQEGHLVRIPVPAQYGKGSEKVQESVAQAMAPTTSLHKPHPASGLDLSDSIPDRPHEEPTVDPRPSLKHVREIIGGFEPRMRRIVELRFAGKTLKEIGDEFGLSKERISQIEDAALAKIRVATGWDSAEDHIGANRCSGRKLNQPCECGVPAHELGVWKNRPRVGCPKCRRSWYADVQRTSA